MTDLMDVFPLPVKVWEWLVSGEHVLWSRRTTYRTSPSAAPIGDAGCVGLEYGKSNQTITHLFPDV
jgi:hypothetical protein